MAPALPWTPGPALGWRRGRGFWVRAPGPPFHPTAAGRWSRCRLGFRWPQSGEVCARPSSAHKPLPTTALEPRLWAEGLGLPLGAADLLGLGPHPHQERWAILSLSREGWLWRGSGCGELARRSGCGNEGTSEVCVQQAWGQLLGPSSHVGTWEGPLSSASGSEMLPGEPGHPRKGCWTHRRSLGPRGPRGLPGTRAGRRQGRAGLSFLLEEGRPCSSSGPSPWLLSDPRAQCSHRHLGPENPQTQTWEAGGDRWGPDLGGRPSGCPAQAPGQDTPSHYQARTQHGQAQRGYTGLSQTRGPRV